MGCLDQQNELSKAAKRIKNIIRKTPLLETRDGFLKLENFQHTGAYKLRGASNAILSIEASSKRGVIAASAGNHASGLAYAAKTIGIQCTAVVPFKTPQVKIDNCRSLGCKVIRSGNTFEESLIEAKKIAVQEDLYFVHAFDNPQVIYGQGTIGLELLAENPDVILVPIGGGGLAAGVALACAKTKVRVVGVQVEGMDAMRRRLENLPDLPALGRSIADGVAVSNPGQLTEQLCRQYLDDIVIVSEADLRDAIVTLAARDNIIAEGAGALSFAALNKVSGRKKIAVITGGNIDLQLFTELVRRQRNRRVA
jgi:threonine dehydratase